MKFEVMLSSTLRGPEMESLRSAALSTIRRAKMIASVCEDWSASSNSTLMESENGVLNADVYVLILGARFGTPISETDTRSFTEFEFDTAAKKTRLAFVQKPVVLDDLDDDAAEQLGRRIEFEKKVRSSSITVKEFQSEEELKTLLFESLIKLDNQHLRAKSCKSKASERFLAVHEYALLDTELVGRNQQLNELGIWASSKTPIFVLEAFGGFGKTALSWTWWKNEAESDHWDGGFWFSFYEPGATPEAFFKQLYDYLSKDSEVSLVGDIEALAKETLDRLRDETHLLVLDGFERMLLRAGTLNSNQEDRHDSETCNSSNLVRNSGRRVCNKILARWLTKLANESKYSRLLITSRYTPRDLETIKEGSARKGVQIEPLTGLDVVAAKEYWEEIGLDSNDPGLERLVYGVHGHPLTLSIMAARLQMTAHRNLEEFFLASPSFPIFKEKVSSDGRDDVFRDALGSLSPNAVSLAQTVALFAAPVSIHELSSIMCKPSQKEEPQRNNFLANNVFSPFTAESEFHRELFDLEDRKLISRNSRQECDMHPLVRSVVRDRTDPEELKASGARIVEVLSQQPRAHQATTLEEIQREIQLVFTASELSNWDIAIKTFAYHVSAVLKRYDKPELTTSLLDRFFEILTKTTHPKVRYLIETPPFSKSNFDSRGKDDPTERFYDHLRKHCKFSNNDIFHFKACHDFSMKAGKSYAALQEYNVARAFYELHNSTCFEPLCQTMQKECFMEAGFFGEAYQLIRTGYEEMKGHPYWESQPFQTSRLAVLLYNDCFDTASIEDARRALALEIKIVEKHRYDALSTMTEFEWLRSVNLKIAGIAWMESKITEACVISKNVADHAERERHESDYFSAIRDLAFFQHKIKDFTAAESTYNELMSMDVDGKKASSLADHMARARNRINLGDHTLARAELNEDIEQSENSISTRAKALIYLSELERELGSTDAEIATLKTALDHYSTNPGTPREIWGPRTVIDRLQQLDVLTENEVEERGFVRLPEWTKVALSRSGNCKITARDINFSLKPRWDLLQ